MEASNLKLYYSKGACSLAPHIVLEEIGQPYALEKVVLSEGQHLHPEYQKIHPFQRVPALQMGDKILTETSAILLHLADRFPEKQLLPKMGTPERALAYEWCSFLSSTVHPAFAQVYRPKRYSDSEDSHASIQESGRSNIMRYYDWIDKRLSKDRYAIGDAYSVCDPYLLVFCRWGYRIHLPMEENYPAFCSYAKRLLERAVVKRVFEQEEIELTG